MLSFMLDSMIISPIYWTAHSFPVSEYIIKTIINSGKTFRRVRPYSCCAPPRPPRAYICLYAGVRFYRVGKIFRSEIGSWKFRAWLKMTMNARQGDNGGTCCGFGFLRHARVLIRSLSHPLFTLSLYFAREPIFFFLLILLQRFDPYSATAVFVAPPLLKHELHHKPREEGKIKRVEGRIN